MLQMQRLSSALGESKISGSFIPVFACVCYAVASMMMTLVNKTLVSPKFYAFPSSEVLILYQNTFSIILLLTAALFNQVEVGWKWSSAKRWIPINIIFLLMLVTGQVSLAFLSVAMVTIFKNFSTIGTTVGDWLLQGNPLTPLIFSSLIVMFFGSMAAGFFDLEYSREGYLWMSANCIFTAAYVLSSKAVLGSVTSTDAALYNNTFSIPTLILWLSYQNRTSEILSAEAWSYPGFWVLLFVFWSMWNSDIAGNFLGVKGNFTDDVFCGGFSEQNSLNHNWNFFIWFTYNSFWVGFYWHWAWRGSVVLNCEDTTKQTEGRGKGEREAEGFRTGVDRGGKKRDPELSCTERTVGLGERSGERRRL